MLSKQFKALADENRLAIVGLLAGGERCLCNISSVLEISPALASHHVKRLDEAGLVKTRRHGLWLHVSLDSKVFTELGEALMKMGAEHPDPVPCCGTSVRKGAIDG